MDRKEDKPRNIQTGKNNLVINKQNKMESQLLSKYYENKRFATSYQESAVAQSVEPATSCQEVVGSFLAPGDLFLLSCHVQKYHKVMQLRQTLEKMCVIKT